MAETGKDPELELDRPARPPTASNPRLQGVRSAARSDGMLPSVRGPITGQRIKEGAADTILNTFSILGEVVEDFKSADRYFKYKALILSVWLVLTITAIGVSRPPAGPSNDIDARLVVSGDGRGSVYMVKNESDEPWLDVMIVVNGGAYRSTLTRLEPHGGNVTLSPAVIFDGEGKRAPPDLTITDVEVHVTDPEASVVLLEGGVPRF